MAKKNLSDLLQEETQKFSPSDGEAVIDVVAIANDTPSDNNTEKDTDSAQLEEPQQAAETTSTKRAAPTKAELEATVKELKEALEKAQQKEISLVQELQVTLEKAEQKEASLVKELKKALEKSQEKEISLHEEVTNLKSTLSEQKKLAAKLKTELDEAKQAAIHLAEANSQLTETISTLQQPKEKAKPQASKSLKSSISNRKTYYTPDKTFKKQSDDSGDNSSQMWLLD